MPDKTINSFGSGELAPNMQGRTDFPRYYNGCKSLQNWIIKPQGGIENRAGTRFIAETKDSTKKSRAIPFVFSQTVFYLLEFGNLYIRFIRNDTLLGAPYEVVTPYLEADLPLLKFDQSADVMYISHPNYLTRKLSRIADTNWTLTEETTKNGPFLNQNLDKDITIQIDYPVWATATSYTKDDVVKIADADATTTTYASATLDNVAAVDNGGGTVILKDTGHSLGVGEGVRITGTTNYDGDYLTQTGTAAPDIVITATYVAETIPGTATQQRFIIPADKGGGLVGIPVVSPAYAGGDIVSIEGTTNYDGTYILHSTTTGTEAVINSAYVFELLDSPFAINKDNYFKALTTHTSGGANPTPPGNVLDWAEAVTFTGTNIILTASSAIFDADHVESLWKLVHPRTDSATSDSFGASAVSSSIFVSLNTSWSFITNGTWVGTVEIRRSFNDGITFETIRSYTSQISTSGEETVGDALYQIKFTRTSGTLGFDFNVEEHRFTGIVNVTGFTSSTVVTGTVIDPIGSILATHEWSEGSWSSHRGFPYDVKFFDTRLVYGGHDFDPVGVWTSKSQDFNDFEAGILDADAIVRRLPGFEINKIQWINSLEDIIIATAGGVWRMGSSDRAQPMSPTNVTHRKQNNSGSADISSIALNNSIVYVSFQGKKILDLIFDSNAEGYQTQDLTIFASHLTENTTITEIAWMKNPDQYLFALRSDGVLLMLHYRREQDQLGWSRFVTDGKIESIAVLPGTDENELYMIVNRTINGVTKRYVERKMPQDFGYDDLTGAWYVDSGLESDGGASVEITGITNANPAVVTSASHGLSNGNKVRIEGVLGMPQANDVFEVDNVTASTYEIKNVETSVDIDSSLWGVYANVASLLNNQDVIDNADGTVTIKQTSHSLGVGHKIRIAGTVHYNGDFVTQTGTEGDNIVITATYVAETIAVTATQKRISSGEKVSKVYTGLSHLEGKVLSVQADGAEVAPKKVSSGQITLDDWANRVITGLPYKAILQPTSPDFESGLLQGKIKRVSRMIFKLHRSVALKVGRRLVDPDELSFSDEDLKMDSSLPLFTGDKLHEFTGVWDRQNDIFIVADKPLPASVLSLSYEIEGSSI